MRRATPRRALLRTALLLALAASAPRSAVAEALDLVGTWYVLIHYKDANSENAEQERWDDRIWEFERRGRRLHWVEYPIVVFEDEVGRFERRSTGQYARILHFWEPNAAQRANIAAGVEVNSRGSKDKTLRGSDAKGWTSGRRSGAASASVVTYEEVWSIDGMPDRPVFRRADFMGGGRTDTLEGLTEYATTELSQGGDRIVGTYVRDGTRRGTFQMLRAGVAGALDTGKSQREIQQEGFRRSIADSPQIRAQAAQEVKEGFEGAGVFLGAAEIDRLAGETVQWTLAGVPPLEIRRRLDERMSADSWSFLPKGAGPGPGARYRFPFDPATPRPLLLGVGAGGSDADRVGEGLLQQFEALARHRGWARHGFDFGMPEGSEVRAARAGEVVRVVDGLAARGGNPKSDPNAVWVLHEDGSAALYLHLASGIPVRPGRRVAAGEVLGRSGTPGYVDTPLLYFGVIGLDASGSPRTLDIRFEDGSDAGLLPVAGRRYPGGDAGP